MAKDLTGAKAPKSVAKIRVATPAERKATVAKNAAKSREASQAKAFTNTKRVGIKRAK